MDPREFNWNAEQQVVVTNPTDKGFRFQVHSKWYEVPAGKTVKMPGFIAWCYVYKLAIVMAVAAKEFTEEWNDQGIRQKYYDQLVVKIEEVIQSVEKVDDESVTTFNDEDLGKDSSEDDETEDEDEEEVEGDTKIKPMQSKRGRPSKK